MGIKFLLMVNKQGQTRLANYYDWFSIEERTALEAEIIRKCLGRTETQCSFMDYRGMRVVYRRYASLFFIVGTDPDEDNELGMLEFIHALVETLDKYFENVCELDIMFNLEKAHFILGACPPSLFLVVSAPALSVPSSSLSSILILLTADEMVTNGCIVETNKSNVLKPILLLEKVSAGK